MGSQESRNLSSPSVANANLSNGAASEVESSSSSSSISTSSTRPLPLAQEQAAVTTTTSAASVTSLSSSSSSSSASTTIFNDGRLYQGGVVITAAAESASGSRVCGLGGDQKSKGSLTTSLQGEVFRQTRTLQRLAGLTYDQFLGYIKELNEISSHFLDSNGKQLVFAVKKGSDSTLLWKATVRVACVKIDINSKNIESHQVRLTLSLSHAASSCRITHVMMIASSCNNDNSWFSILYICFAIEFLYTHMAFMLVGSTRYFGISNIYSALNVCHCQTELIQDS